jgi:uncharacterized membrane protein
MGFRCRVRIVIHLSMDISKLKIKYVLEVGAMMGLLCVWLSYFVQNIYLIKHVSPDEEETIHGLEIPMPSRILFLIGDVLYTVSGTFLLFRLKAGTDESVKLTWTMLFIGVTLSIHVPIVIRAWIFRSIDYKNTGEEDPSKLAWPVLSTAIVSAFAICLSLIAAISIELFQDIGSSHRIIKKYAKWMCVVGIACGEFFFISGIIEYELVRTLNSSLILLIFSLLLTAVGYLPGRILIVFRDQFDDDELPLLRQQ